MPIDHQAPGDRKQPCDLPQSFIVGVPASHHAQEHLLDDVFSDVSRTCVTVHIAEQRKVMAFEQVRDAALLHTCSRYVLTCPNANTRNGWFGARPGIAGTYHVGNHHRAPRSREARCRRVGAAEPSATPRRRARRNRTRSRRTRLFPSALIAKETATRRKSSDRL